MKIRAYLATIMTVVVLVPAVAQKSKADKKEKKEDQAKAIALASSLDSVSYGLGVLFGNNLIQSGFSGIDTKLMMAAIDQMLAKQKTLVDETKANEVVGNYFRNQQQAKGAQNLKAGRDWLEKNKKDSGVVVLPSGLQYKIIKNGTGPKPSATDKVSVHYHGMLIDGKVFDSSVERGEPITLSVNGVIEGWKEALPMMPVGSKWKLFIPSELAYGDRQMQGSPIEANSVLVFDVELLSIEKPEAQQPEIPKVDEQPTIQPQTKK
jgi:FKBP-type peptidyl-prolyl cis-trans isomerase FklB